MTTLVLSFQGPLQSWGLSGRFNVRDTGRHPTKSATIGLIAAAMGRDRDADIPGWAAARFSCRLDDPGKPTRDFHTIGDSETKMPTADGRFRDWDKGIILTDRWYLQDAAFTVCLEGDTDWAEQVEALERPRWQPYLGRRSCVPVGPLVLGVTTRPAGELLSSLPLLRSRPRRAGPTVGVQLAETDDRGELVPDEPRGGRRFHRRPERLRRAMIASDLCLGKGVGAWRGRRRALEVGDG